MTNLGTIWAKTQKDISNSGRTTYTGIATPALDMNVETTPYSVKAIVIGADQSVYYVYSNVIKKIDSNADPMWTYSHSNVNEISRHIVLDDDGNCYFLVKSSLSIPDGYLYCINYSDGTLKWQSSISITADALSGITIYNDKIYIGCSGSDTKKLYTINTIDGSLANTFSSTALTDQHYQIATLRTSGGKVIVYATYGFKTTPRNGKLSAIDTSISPYIFKAEWTSGTVNNVYVYGTVPISDDGILYTIVDGNKIKAINSEDGSVIWSYTDGSTNLVPDYPLDYYLAPSIDFAGNVVFVSYYGKVYKINGSTGTLLWSYPLNGICKFPASIDGNNDIYVYNSTDEQLYKISSDGVVKWNESVVGAETPAIIASNKVYIGGSSGITAFKETIPVAVKGYNVYRSIDSSNFEKINTSLVTNINYIDTNLSSGRYYYQVRAVSFLDVASDEADIIGVFAIDVVSPDKPTNLSFTVSNNKIVLTWNAPTENTDGSALTDLLGYRVYRSTIPGSAITLGGVSGSPMQSPQLTGFTSTNEISGLILENTYTDEGLIPGYYYYYSVRAVDQQMNLSPYADELKAGLTLYTWKFQDGINIVGLPFRDSGLEEGGVLKVSKLIEKIGLSKVQSVLKWNEILQGYEQYEDDTTFGALEANKGYIFIVDSATDINVDTTGTTWEQPEITIVKNKSNLINLPLNDYKTVYDLVTALGGSQNVKAIVRYNATNKKYEQYLPELDKGDFTDLTYGTGYFVLMTVGLTDKSLNFTGSPWV